MMAGVRGRVRRAIGRHVGGTAVVLIYHRVAELDTDPQLLAVRPERFEAHMRLIAEEFAPLSLAQLADGLARRNVPDRAVAVTFDDGYADNLVNAEPVLARHGVPATVFVSSGYVGSGREFWWDELERILLAGEPQSWNVLEAPQTARQREYLELSERMRPLTADARREALDALRATAGVGPDARPSHRQLDAEEVARLDSSAVAEVGGHTVNHVLLTALALEDQRTEIETDAGALAGLCGHRMRAFSYPYGGLDDYTDESVALVKEAGYTCACSNHPGVVKPWTDPYRLPRHIVRDWPAEEFSRRLRGWFDGAN